MSAPVEELLRDALKLQADRAAPPGRILAARRPARRRARFLVPAVAALAFVAAAVAVVPLVFQREDFAPAGEPIAVGAPLRYAPTWLPDGDWGYKRVFVMDGGHLINATFRSETAKVFWYVDFSGGVHEPDGEPIDVNGQTGYLKPNDHEGWSASYEPEPGVFVGIDASQEIPRDQVERMARSIRPTDATIGAPMSLRWLPAGFRYSGGELRMTRSGTILSGTYLGPAERSARPDGKFPEEPKIVINLMSPDGVPPGGEPLTVAGRAARYQTEPDVYRLVLDLDDGWAVVIVFAGFDEEPSRAEITRVAEYLTPGQPFDPSWITTP